jgi:hypothetical protein
MLNVNVTYFSVFLIAVCHKFINITDRLLYNSIPFLFI